MVGGGRFIDERNTCIIAVSFQLVIIKRIRLQVKKLYNYIICIVGVFEDVEQVKLNRWPINTCIESTLEYQYHVWIDYIQSI